ncbi:metalloregulator ArsR/SmtB family transcription factor [Ruania suaedae]|uniref:ArsR/SmtB family transcription factor n=1 Tax=Ruania suaedae TaxID=2897774 RepID=UPI001E578EC4|nr:metalloregulator ArsR/SmtB family transcription factor [Ruania suaedae]UFU02016.1 metalloregulator ArsR/SmtB family transcription factor [Ruania suaedae]
MTSATTALEAPPEEVRSVCAALADETRWQILAALASADLSASELARALPVSRQAIAKHLGVLAAVGLVEQVDPGQRQLRYRAVGAPLSRLAGQLETIGRGWDRRLARIKEIAES